MVAEVLLALQGMPRPHGTRRINRVRGKPGTTSDRFLVSAFQ